MPSDPSIDQRRAEFARNERLESLLGTLNSDLALAEAQAMQPYHGQQPRFPPIFIMGAPRCGSTLFMQWLASTGVFAFPSNMLSRFWAAPIIGTRIQKALTDPDYDFRDELHDFKGETGFESHHGKTTGALSPNEFWYFWRRFFPGNDYHPQEVLERTVDTALLKAELAGIIDVLDKPFAAKGMIFNENIPFMAQQFPNAIFVWIRRRPEYNIQSLLLARKRQYGDMRQWYSFKIRAYHRLKDLPPVEAVSGQVASIHAAIARGLETIGDERKLVVNYEDFCRDPEAIYRRLTSRLAIYSAAPAEYKGPSEFRPREEWRLDCVTENDVRSVYEKYVTI